MSQDSDLIDLEADQNNNNNNNNNDDASDNSDNSSQSRSVLSQNIKTSLKNELLNNQISTKKRSGSSWVNNHFENVDYQNNQFCICLVNVSLNEKCFNIYKANTSTRNLANHLINVHNLIKPESNISQSLHRESFISIPQNIKSDLAAKIATWVASDGRALSIGDSKSFIDVLYECSEVGARIGHIEKAQFAQDVVPQRGCVTNHVEKDFNEKQKLLKQKVNILSDMMH